MLARAREAARLGNLAAGMPDLATLWIACTPAEQALHSDLCRPTHMRTSPLLLRLRWLARTADLAQRYSRPAEGGERQAP